MFMATASRSSRANPTDARINCPVCGQHIHPVAGKCKHCKTDLVKLREQQGVRAPRIDAAVLQSAAAFVPQQPTFGAAPPAMAAPPPIATPAAPDQATTLQDLPAVQLPAAATLIQPMSHNGHEVAAYPVESSRSAWARRWPILVLAIAGVAILVCAYLLLFANDGSAEAKKASGKAPIGPDRMDTMPKPQGPTPTPSQPSPTPAVPHDTDPPPDDPAPPDFDPGAPPDPTPFGSGGPVPPPEQFYGTLIDQACAKMKACGLDLSAGTGIDICGQMRDSAADMQADAIRAGRCTYDENAARQCLDAVTALRCDANGTMDESIVDLFIGAPSCTMALQCH
jgi:hypothetical protein